MNSKLKTARTIVLTVVCFLFWYANANAGVDYCHDDDAGDFTFGVEQAIDVECTGDVDMGPICPGCSYQYPCDDPAYPHMIFDVTGAYICPFKITFTAWNDNGKHIQLHFNWNKWNGSLWLGFQSFNTPLSFDDLDNDGVGDFRIGAFICDWIADCEAPAGDYTRTITVKVDYVCL